MKTLACILLSSFSLLFVSAQSTNTASALGRNIIGLSPIQFMVMDHLDSEPGSDVGVNVSYERISANEYFGFKLPVSFSLRNPYYYFMPALKIYPFKQGPVKFAFGPQFYFGTGEIDYDLIRYNYNVNQDTVITKDRTQIGFLINTSVNFTILQNFYLGIEAGLGINYFDDNADDSDLYLDDSYFYNRNKSEFYPALQLNFAMGYRF